MKKNTLQMLFAFFLASQCCFAQVDVVYNDLVWSDEFDTNGVVNANNWFHQTQLPAGGNWYNNEAQHYTGLQTNSFVDAGFLNIVAKKENFTDQGVTKGYTSARLNSKFSFKYGRIDVRAKIPVESGTWPAIWMLGKNVNEDGGYYDATYGTTNWPACGEIDIMEHVGNQPNEIHGTLHYPGHFAGNGDTSSVTISNVASEFHIYSVDWRAEAIRFYVDGKLFKTFVNSSSLPFNKNFFLIFNVAMGGGFGGAIDPAFAQSSMEIDYIRVYN